MVDVLYAFGVSFCRISGNTWEFTGCILPTLCMGTAFLTRLLIAAAGTVVVGGIVIAGAGINRLLVTFCFFFYARY